jgi:plastocyanin
MKLPTAALLAVTLAAVGVLVGRLEAGGAQATGRGTIKGHVKLTGKLPGNPVIRMAADPMCARMNAGKRVIQMTVAASIDGSLANTFVHLQGTFPQTAVPTMPVTVDQSGCVYVPRVVGVRIGQVLQVKNSDALLHNVHAITAHDNTFNVGQPVAGMVFEYKPKTEEIMLRLKCDIHSWMTAFVGVVPHPYFAVSDDKGTFQIDNVPAGTHKIQTWHERYGALTQTVKVTAGGTATVEFAYTGTEPPPTASLRDLSPSDAFLAPQVVAAR